MKGVCVGVAKLIIKIKLSKSQSEYKSEINIISNSSKESSTFSFCK